jgi:hypothetical protein
VFLELKQHKLGMTGLVGSQDFQLEIELDSLPQKFKNFMSDSSFFIELFQQLF